MDYWSEPSKILTVFRNFQTLKVNIFRSFFLAFFAFMFTACGQSNPKTSSVLAPASAPIDLKVGEGFENPLGYYEASPRFSWKVSKDSNAQFQSAYQIQAATSLERLSDDADLWDSGKVFSPKTSWISYKGENLVSRQELFWRVKLWDESDQPSAWSAPQSVELGLLENGDWRGKWIGHPDTRLSESPTQATLATPQYLRKTFSVDENVKLARLYVTAKGLFKPYMNGAEIAGKDVMTPGWTPYAKRIESLTYDVTDKIIQGENTIGASIAGGWYAGRVSDFLDRDHKLPARLLAQLEITYANGETHVVTTDDSWEVSQSGPIRFASIYDGEHYDQGQEILGWTTAEFNSSNWAKAVEEPLDAAVAIKPKRHSPIRFTQTLPVKEIVKADSGVAIFDFGQNMVGVPRLQIPVLDGQEVKIRFAEALHKGEFYTDNYRSAESTNLYLPSKTGWIDYHPTFTYHGYRYIEVSGFDPSQKPTKEWATALIQHSDIHVHAKFESSHPKLNQLSKNIVWGMRSNFYDIPLDCPQRDERLGWTGDAQVFVTPSMYMADTYGFWSAWLQSVREEQGADGKIPVYVPFVEWINFASSGWGDAVTIIPWELYMATGDDTILADNYDMMKGWLNYHEKKSENLISNMSTFGDWLQPYPQNVTADNNGNRGDTDYSLIGTAYYARSVELTLKTAEVLGKNQDALELKALHNDIKQAFLEHFFDKDLILKNGRPTQTTYLLGLAYDLFPEDKRDIAVDHLIAEIAKADFHLRTGFLGTPLLTQVLQDVGRSDIIYELLFKESYPSWFHSINNGATTTWERWDSYSINEGFNPQGMNSLNHYAYGTVSRWFYEGILGITPVEPGFKKLRIEPQFGEQLSSAKGGYLTPQGEVFVNWTTDGGRLKLDVTVPKNTVADIVLPAVSSENLTLNGVRQSAEKLMELKPGNYQISANLN
jgi:alpha-L-rhamnosidase